MIARGMLRGGLVGAVLSIAFSVLGVIPICGFAALPLRMAAWTLGGYLGGRTAVRGGARQGGIVAGAGAGVIAGLLDGLANIALAPIRFNLAGDMVSSLFLLPEGVVKVFNDVGINLMTMNTLGGSLFLASMMCGVLWLVAGALGTLGGAFAQALSD